MSRPPSPPRPGPSTPHPPPDVRLPRPFPPSCASAWGDDRYGLWINVTLAGATQRFRWITPGRFLMGSPPDEPGHDVLELQHEVTLSRGYWLAESACTQALWHAVMGENPSEFGDDPACPVETVSWDQVQDCLARLNTAIPALDARLPTEAEWEYACRAGTTTAFSFGTRVTPAQVNYDAEHDAELDPPPTEDPTLSRRGRTVPVTHLPANAWGLYQMHGNVQEWCADWFDRYDPAPVIDPVGPQTGQLRVLRGGSWLDDSLYARSAYRIGLHPSSTSPGIGFRLALGHEAG